MMLKQLVENVETAATLNSNGRTDMKNELNREYKKKKTKDIVNLEDCGTESQGNRLVMTARLSVTDKI